MNSESWNRLFSREELQVMYDRAQAQQFAERQRKLAEMQADYQRAEATKIAPREKSAFVYQVRAPELWAARADQQIHRRWQKINGHYTLSPEERARLAEKVQTLLELAVEYRDETDMEELAASADMSVSWVRKHLRKAGIRLPLRRQRQT
jgi:hypothetical protein